MQDIPLMDERDLACFEWLAITIAKTHSLSRFYMFALSSLKSEIRINALQGLAQIAWHYVAFSRWLSRIRNCCNIQCIRTWFEVVYIITRTDRIYSMANRIYSIAKVARYEVARGCKLKVDHVWRDLESFTCQDETWRDNVDSMTTRRRMWVAVHRAYQIQDRHLIAWKTFTRNNHCIEYMKQYGTVLQMYCIPQVLCLMPLGWHAMSYTALKSHNTRYRAQWIIELKHSSPHKFLV